MKPPFDTRPIVKCSIEGCPFPSIIRVEIDTEEDPQTVATCGRDIHIFRVVMILLAIMSGEVSR